nr:hypothetical protein [Tanacetum cinerariifolium]
MKIRDPLKKRIEKAGQHLNKEKQIMHINKGKEKMVMKRALIVLGNKKKLLKNQGLDLPKRKKNLLKVNKGQGLQKKKTTIPSEIAQWYDDFSSDEMRTVYKGRRGSSFRNAAITKPKKPKSRSKHLAPTTLRTGSTCTTVVVQTKRPPRVTNFILGLAAVTTWQKILNKEFGMKSSKENVGGSSNVRMKGKRKML